MKSTILIFVFVVLAIGHVTSQSIQNPDFESWESFGRYSNPENWDSDNESVSSIPNLPEYPVEMTDDSYSGDSAIILRNIHVQMIGRTIPGVITNGRFKLSPSFEPKLHGGTPFSSRPKSLTGYYKYFPEAGDSFAVLLYLTRYDQVNQRQDTIGLGIFTGSDSVDTYEMFEAEINYFSSEMPDSMLIIIVSSASPQPKMGTELYVDHLGMTSGTSVNEMELNQPEVWVHPNPAFQNIYINNVLPGSQCRLFSIDGNLVLEEQIADASLSINIGHLTPGIYFYQVSTPGSNSIQMGKLMIMR